MKTVGRAFEREKILPAADEAAAPQDFAKMTVDALKGYAAENAIDLTGAKTKAEIIAAISAAEETSVTEAPSVTGAPGTG